jgi:hypothetical protein
MTQQERDMMVERYMDGSMSQPERHNFLDLLDNDEGMRQTLYAETLINKAVKSDRSAMPMPAAASRERFLTMLAAVAPETAAPSSGTGRGSGSAGKGIAGGGATKVIVSTLAGLAVTVGAIVFVPKLIESPAPKQPAAVAPAKVAQPAPQETIAPQPAETIPQVTTGEAPTEPQTEAASPGARKRMVGAEIERREAVRAIPAAKPRTSDEATTVKKEEPKVVNDGAKARLNVNDPTIKR